METTDVTLWGRDYSAREFTPEDFDRYQRENPRERPVQWLDRYIGYPNNTKCISHYPGMYQRHWETGRPVSLFHQIGYSDMDGGYDRGRAHALVARADAERVGWNGESHITACFDRFYALAGYRTLTAADLRAYMSGFRSVLGDRTGFYGFYDSMRSAVTEGWASFFVQCGARSAHVPGIHAWQENNYQPLLFGTQTDILEMYCDPSYAFGGDVMTPEQLNALGDSIAEKVKWTLVEFRPDGRRNLWDNDIHQNSLGETQASLLAQIAKDENVTPEKLQAAINEAVEAAEKRQTAELKEALFGLMTEAVTLVRDADNLDEAKKTAAELMKRIGALFPPALPEGYLDGEVVK